MQLSVITPTYNRGEAPFLREVCESITQAKDYHHLTLEHLIVNDGSNDRTEQEIRALQRRFPHIRYLKNPANRGITFSKNHALAEAHGDLIIEIDDDDLVPYYALGLRVQLLLQSDHAWLCGNALTINETGQLQFRDNLLGRYIPDQWECFRAFYEGRHFAFSGTRIYYKEALERIHGWNEHIHSLCEDFDLWLRMTYACGAPAFSEIPLIYWRQKESSLGIDAVRSGAYLSKLHEIKDWYKDWYGEALQRQEIVAVKV
ncbi:MAG TPA: glycosyltransferase family 2 protein [Ktedonobacteraceae bacterium]|jgi:glycosyltransferase involved in cell wall biosynthesis